MIEQEYLKAVLDPLVENPDAIEVEVKKDDRGVLIILYVAKPDLGRVIGKKGETANALRTLLRVLGAKNNARYNLKVDSKVTHSVG